MRSPVALGLPAVILPLLFACSPGPRSQAKSSPPVVWVNASENLAPGFSISARQTARPPRLTSASTTAASIRSRAEIAS